MQKVESSSLFSRLIRKPRSGGAFVVFGTAGAIDAARCETRPGALKRAIWLPPLLAIGIIGVLFWRAAWTRPGQAQAARTSAPATSSATVWWYSRTRDTSAPTVANGRGIPGPQFIEKWADLKGDQFERSTIPGHPRLTDAGYQTSDGPPGFADWDPIGVTVVPGTPAGIRALLRSTRLADSYPKAAEGRSPLTWLAELSAMLADDPTTPAQRAAAMDVINHLPGLRRLAASAPSAGTSVTVAEQAQGLRPLLIAAGPGCHNPYGGAGWNGVATPPGSFELRLTYDPADDLPLAVETIALHSIPRARIIAGEPVYRVRYLAGRFVSDPHIPPLPKPLRVTEQSVPWRLLRKSGSTIRVAWQSGTCLPGVRPHAYLRARTTSSMITLAVIARVARATGSQVCAGVGLGGTLSIDLQHPIDKRIIKHAAVTDHDR